MSSDLPCDPSENYQGFARNLPGKCQDFTRKSPGILLEIVASALISSMGGAVYINPGNVREFPGKFPGKIREKSPKKP